MTHKKPHLPTRVCEACGREYAWRKRWRNNWTQVRYCSQRCRRQSRGSR